MSAELIERPSVIHASNYALTDYLLARLMPNHKQNKLSERINLLSTDFQSVCETAWRSSGKSVLVACHCLVTV